MESLNHDLRQAIKEAFTEALHEQRDLVREIVAEAMEDIGLEAAIADGKETELIDRNEVMQLLEETP